MKTNDLWLPLMLATTTFGAMSGSAFAQSTDNPLEPRTTPVQHGGVFHVATGTWTRQVPQSVSLGPDIIYNNSAHTGGFTSGGIEAQASSFAFVDAGRIPSSTSPTPGAQRDRYNVNCVELAYCLGDDSGALGPLNVEVQLYNHHTTCTDPSSALNVGGLLGTGLPGFDPVTTPAGYLDCWVVEFDLSGGGEICILGDGDGVYDGVDTFDRFGIGVRFDPDGSGGYVGAIPVGPILAGDRDWTVAAAGGYAGGVAGGGDTYFGPAETCVPLGGGRNSSGFDQEDGWWITERLSTSQSAGCYWFGGYQNATGCAADGVGPGHVPNAGLYAVLMADQTDDCIQVDGGGDVVLCDPANANSQGTSAALTATTLTSGVGSGLHLEVTGGVPGQFGYFLIGSNPSSPLPLSDGLLCLATTGGSVLGRYNYGTDTHSIGNFDAAGRFQNLVGTATSTGGSGFDVPTTHPVAGQPAIAVGSTWYFQFWYRDTPAGVGVSNLSNGLAVTF